MKALLFVILAHFALSMNHDDMEAQNERLRDSNKALLRALKAMTGVESEVESEVGWLDIMDDDEFELSESDDFDWDEEEIGGKRRRRRRRRRRSKPAPKPEVQPKPAPKPQVQPEPAPKPQPKPAPKREPFTLVVANKECNDNSREHKLGNFGSVKACAKACRNRPGCKTFIFGKGGKWGRCYDEGRQNKNDCSVWQNDQYDFYQLNPMAEFEFAIAMEDPEIFSDEEFEVAGYDE